MGKHTKPPAKLPPWWKRTKASVAAHNTGCPECKGTGICPNCHGDSDGCTVCLSTGVCPYCCELPARVIGE